MEGGYRKPLGQQCRLPKRPKDREEGNTLLEKDEGFHIKILCLKEQTWTHLEPMRRAHFIL